MLVDPELEWPLHLQLAAQLQAAIEDQEYQVGERLPSVRELAAILRVNRNTIVHAYAMLEQTGYARSEPGRGYFAAVPARPGLPLAPQKLLQETLMQLKEQQVDPLVFARALWARALKLVAEKEANSPKTAVAVVECTQDQSSILARDLSDRLGIEARPILLSNLAFVTSEELATYSLIVTTYQHVDEIRERVPGRTSDILPCLLTAHLDTLRRLSQVPRGARIGVACMTWEGTHRLSDMVHEAGFPEIMVVEGSGAEPATLPPLLENTALIIAASRVAEILLAFRPDAPVLADDRTFTEGALESIKKRIAGEKA